MWWMEKNELYVMGVFVIPKVEQVSDINFIYQELYPGNVNVSISHIFLHDSFQIDFYYLWFMHMPCQRVFY